MTRGTHVCHMLKLIEYIDEHCTVHGIVHIYAYNSVINNK